MTHPLKPAVEAIRETIRSAAPGITEGVKWNSPSFYCHGWFATINSRKPTQLDVVLHCGAKAHPDCLIRQTIDDTEHLLTWPSPDRAILSFRSEADIGARREAFQRVVRGWTAYLANDHGGPDTPVSAHPPAARK